MKKVRYLNVILIACMAIIMIFVATSCKKPEEVDEELTKLVRVDTYGDPENLDPILKDKITALVLNDAIFEQIIDFDAVEGTFKPELAIDWDVSSDSLTYTFKLREGAKFHNGQEITADDVKYSYERLLDPNSASPLSSTLYSIKGAREFMDGTANEVAGIKVIDEYNIEITLSQPDPVFLQRLSSICCSIVPREAVEELKAVFGMRPVGSGPYFRFWVKDSKVVLKANPRSLGRKTQY